MMVFGKHWHADIFHGVDTEVMYDKSNEKEILEPLDSFEPNPKVFVGKCDTLPFEIISSW
jgi:hypothetical protein